MSLRHVLLSVALGVAAMSAQAAEANRDWITPAEAAQFRTTPSYADTLAYLERLQRAAPGMIRVATFGTTLISTCPMSIGDMDVSELANC